MSRECQASTLPKSDKKSRPAIPRAERRHQARACGRCLRFSLALLQDALFRTAAEGLAVLLDGLGFAGFAPALRQETCLGRSDQRLAVLIDVRQGVRC